MIGKRVLIVDDEPGIVVSLEFLMEQEGFTVTVARDGRAAVESVRRHAPDLILLDVMLPHLSGYDVCREVRADPAARSAKIIMLTARGREAEIEHGLEVGADAWLTKPFATRDLLAQVRRLVAAP